jgi:fatty-acyl-CoA synthase
MPDPGTRRRWTYAELLTDSERVARALLARFRPGERVAVWAPNIPEWVLLEFGAALAGIVLVTVNPALRRRETAYVLAQSRSVGLFYFDEFRGNPMAATVAQLRPELPELRDAVSFSAWDEFLAAGDPSMRLPEVRPGDPAQIQYTSGTTGFPKGAHLLHRGITNNARFTFARAGMRRGAAWVNPMPLFHTGGCVLGVLGPVWFRGTHVPVLAFEPGMVLELIEAERAYGFGAVPTMLIAMLEHATFRSRDLSSLGVVVSGGSTVPADLVRRIEGALGVKISIVFGQTELSPVVTQTRLSDTPEDTALTIGQPLPQVECRIVDAEGKVVPVGVAGEFCARGYQVMREYFDKPEATAETIDADGWLHTGDLCAMDERGYFSITGRLKDMIIRGGENIYPREIEECLFAHPGVADVAVVGVPDERWGESVAAVVRAADPANPPAVDELFAFCRERLAPHKAPRHWYYIDAFPLTGSGKVQKFVLRERIAKHEIAEAGVSGR